MAVEQRHGHAAYDRGRAAGHSVDAVREYEPPGAVPRRRGQSFGEC